MAGLNQNAWPNCIGLLTRPLFSGPFGVGMPSSLMTYPDARTLTPAAQPETRRIAMTMREAGSRFSEIGCALGVHYMTVSKWWDRDQDGADALAAQKRGPAVGAHRRLTAKQEQAVRRAITDTTPDQVRRPFAL